MKLGTRALGPFFVVLLLSTGGVGGLAADQPLALPPGQPWGNPRQELDASSPIESRIRDAAQPVYSALNHFRRREVGPPDPRPAEGNTPVPQRIFSFRDLTRQPVGPLRGPEPRPHALTEVERLKWKAAIELLPPRQWRVLTKRLRSVNFLDNMPVGGMVLPAESSGPDPLYDIAISAAVLAKTASEWLTEKERSIFRGENSPMTVKVNAGPNLEAIAYVLLHEATHVVDQCERITEGPPTPLSRSLFGFMTEGPPTHPFLAGIWTNRWKPQSRYLDARRNRIQFYEVAGAISANEILLAYWSLAETPFVSLYSARNAMEDLAEYATVFHLTEVMHQPFRIEIFMKGVKIQEYEPMRSRLARSRIETMKHFYE